MYKLGSWYTDRYGWWCKHWSFYGWSLVYGTKYYNNDTKSEILGNRMYPII